MKNRNTVPVYFTRLQQSLQSQENVGYPYTIY